MKTTFPKCSTDAQNSSLNTFHAGKIGISGALGRESRRRSLLPPSPPRQFARNAHEGISRNRLVSYELGLVPLPWKVGDDFCRQFGFSQQWLATGERPKKIYAPLDPEAVFGISERESFHSVVFFKILPAIRVFYENLAKQCGGSVDSLDGVERVGPEKPAQGSELWQGVVTAISNFAAEHAKHMPPSLHHRFFEESLEAFIRFSKAHKKEIAAYRKTFSPSLRNIKPMSPKQRASADADRQIRP